MGPIRHIRIISPSGAIDPGYIDGATMRLRAWGFKVSEGAHAREVYGRFAGSDEERLADLCEAMSAPDVDLILCSRGGYGLQRLADRIPPVTKPVLGFSDVTVLHQLSAISSQPSIHGIMCKHIATLPEESEPIQALKNILTQQPSEIHYRWETHPLNRYGDAEGRLTGGNLSVLYGLQGTPYEIRAITNDELRMTNYELEKPILLIEDIGERHYHIDRMMRNLRMSGVLERIGGLIVGQFSGCEDDPQMRCSVYETIKEAVAEYNYPVIFNAPIGHVEHNLPVWLQVHTSIHSGADGVLLHHGLQV